MHFENLTPELKEKALACETTDELVELAKSEGVDLSDEELDGISGGDWNCGDCSEEGGGCCGSTRAQASKDGGPVSIM